MMKLRIFLTIPGSSYGTRARVVAKCMEGYHRDFIAIQNRTAL